MHMDVTELREFYGKPLGQAAENSITMALSSIWGETREEQFLGLGYPLPWMDRFAADSSGQFCLMPAHQGAVHWPATGPSATLLAHDDEFPFRDASFDRILMAHFLEHAENANDCLAEAWRVLSPGGTLIVIAPNRRGVWARFENTPFGTGKPYSRGQLSKALRANQFTPEAWAEALLFTPSERDFALRTRSWMETMGKRMWPVFAGAICVVATKRLYQGIPVTARAKRRLAVPVLVPQPTGRVGRNQTE